MMRSAALLLLAALWAGPVVPAGSAQTPAPNGERVLKAYVGALETGDVDAVLAHWHDDGDLRLPFARIGAPQRFAGRRALRAHYRAWLDSIRVTGVKRVVRLSDSTVATPDARPSPPAESPRADESPSAGSTAPESAASSNGPRFVVRYDAVVVRGDARTEQDFVAFVTLRGGRIQSMMRVPDPIVLRDGFAPAPAGDGLPRFRERRP